MRARDFWKLTPEEKRKFRERLRERIQLREKLRREAEVKLGQEFHQQCVEPLVRLYHQKRKEFIGKGGKEIIEGSKNWLYFVWLNKVLTALKIEPDEYFEVQFTLLRDKKSGHYQPGIRPCHLATDKALQRYIEFKSDFHIKLDKKFEEIDELLDRELPLSSPEK